MHESALASLKLEYLGYLELKLTFEPNLFLLHMRLNHRHNNYVLH